jgi:hypothetical protein
VEWARPVVPTRDCHTPSCSETPTVKLRDREREVPVIPNSRVHAKPPAGDTADVHAKPPAGDTADVTVHAKPPAEDTAQLEILREIQLSERCSEPATVR